MSLSPLEILGGERGRSLGGEGSEGRVPDSLSIRTTPFTRPNFLSGIRSQFHQGSSSGGRAGGIAAERGSGACRSVSRVLCPNVCGSEGVRCLEAGDRSFGSQQARSQDSLQDGDRPVSFKFSPSRGLDVLHRPEGCIPSGPYTSSKQMFSAVCHKNRDLPVSVPVLRPFHSTSSFYPSDGPGVSISTSSRSATSPLLGRLAGFGQDGDCVLSGEGSGDPVVFSTGYSDQLREIISNSFPSFNVSGNSDRFQNFEGFSDGETRQQATSSCRRISVLRRTAGKIMNVSSGIKIPVPIV